MAQVYRSRTPQGSTSSAWAWVIGGIAVIVLVLIFAPMFTGNGRGRQADQPGIVGYEQNGEMFEAAPEEVTATDQTPPVQREALPEIVTVNELVDDPNARALAGQRVDLADLRVTRKVSDDLVYVEPADTPGHRPLLIASERATALEPNQIVSIEGTLRDPLQSPPKADDTLTRDARMSLNNSLVYLEADRITVEPRTKVSRKP